MTSPSLKPDVFICTRIHRGQTPDPLVIFFLLLARHYQSQHLAAESGFGDYMYIFI